LAQNITEICKGKEINSSLISNEKVDKKDKDLKKLVSQVKNISNGTSSDPSSEEQINSRVKN
jgi:hypothetical protein